MATTSPSIVTFASALAISLVTMRSYLRFFMKKRPHEVKTIDIISAVEHGLVVILFMIVMLYFINLYVNGIYQTFLIQLTRAVCAGVATGFIGAGMKLFADKLVYNEMMKKRQKGL